MESADVVTLATATTAVLNNELRGFAYWGYQGEPTFTVNAFWFGKIYKLNLKFVSKNDLQKCTYKKTFFCLNIL